MNALVKSQRLSFLSLLLCLGLQAISYGQPKAAFSATPAAGCSPMVVYFFDSSSGAPTQWRWELGNGVTSFLRNPSATYFNPGTYTVKLVVRNAAGKDSLVKKEFITVYASPKVDFSVDKESGCFPLPVQFSDKSSSGSGALVSWQWDFGDGTLSTQQHPAHTYASAGAFSTTLKVTNSSGCSKTFSKPQTVTIANGVKAAFTHTDPGLCPAPATVQFTNRSTGPPPLDFAWSFGDGSTSTTADPVHQYNINGAYTVRLIAASPLGCADTVTLPQAFNIGSARADFSVPAAVCANRPVSFTNTSSSLPVNVKWEFGDGTYSTLANPVKTYTGPGTFTVKLITDFGTCSDTAKKSVQVSALPSADFTATQQSSCNLPVDVKLKALATGSTNSFIWDFGDSTTGTGSQPTHRYTREGTYTVRLIVTTSGDCSDTLTKTDFVNVYKPQITVTGLPKNGCTPLAVSPAASVAGGSITGYQWNFGDGATSTAAKPSHTYLKKGTYDVTLIATTSAGCTDTVFLEHAVRMGEKPRAGFVHTPVTVCPYEQVSFTDKSTGSVDQWFWDFGDGGTSGEKSPLHQYGDTGWHNVTLVVYDNTCADTAVLQQAVYVNPPFAVFDVKNDCSDKYTKTFVDGSLGAKTWFWEFGDGGTSSLQNPTHIYAKTGTYSAKLTVTNGSCMHYLVKTVLVIDEKADFIASDSTVCRNGTVSFNSLGANAANLAIWYWNFGDGTYSSYLASESHAYTNAGTYTVTLVLNDLLGCPITKSLPVKVFGPTAVFEPAVASACLKDNNVVFNEASASDGQHPVVKRFWHYGDGVVDSTTSTPYQHRYTAAGVYNVSLTVVDNRGCRDSSTKEAAVVIAQPVAAFATSDSLSCTGKAILFTNTSSAVSPQSAWSFGDGSVSSEIAPVHAYGQTGSYSIKLVVKDGYGCVDSISKKAWINIVYPKAAFRLSDSVGTCPPLLVHFTNTSTDYKTIQWHFGDGNASALDTPSHFYSVPGTYVASLVATSYGGCTDTVRKTIVVKGPTGSFTYKPLVGCNPLAVNFAASTQGNASFVWDFSDGETEASKSTTTAHTYTDAGDFVPKIILKDSGGCTVPVVGKDTIRVKGVVADFGINAALFCNDGVAQFSNGTVSNDFITGYQWNFGDGSTGTAPNPVHRYALPGLYTVQLEVTTESGCTDKKTFVDTVKVYPAPVVQVTGDSAACAPALFTYKAEVLNGRAAGLQWAWNFGNGQTAAVQAPASQSYTEGAYAVSVVATDGHGCSDTAFKNATVYPVPKTSAGEDAWICRGGFQQLKATGAETYQWQEAHSLSCAGCDGPLAAPTEETSYVVTGTNHFGCSKEDTVIIKVYQPFTLAVEKGDTVCVGETVRLAATGADQYTWTPSLGVKETSNGITTAVPTESTLYTVAAKDDYNCFTNTGSVFIKVWPVPLVEIEETQTLAVGNSLQLAPKYSADVTSYQWSNAQTLSCVACPAPVARPKTETKYTVDVKNEGGCAAKDAVTVHVICNGGNLFIPNTFSPNKDGRNERFYPRGTGIGRVKSLTVYNRWGQPVFSRENFDANNAAAGWDGTFKGAALTPDVYVYTCEVVCQNNEMLTYKGDVTLLR